MRARSLPLPLALLAALAAAFVALQVWPPAAPVKNGAAPRPFAPAHGAVAPAAPDALADAAPVPVPQRAAAEPRGAGAAPLHGTVTISGGAPCAGASIAAATTGVEEY